LEALIRQLDGLVRQLPVVMVFEDAHWIDPTSRELLDLTVERVRSLPVLLIVTFRPDFQPPWTGQPQVTMLALNRLPRHDGSVLVAQIAGGKALPDEVIGQIIDRTDGEPLFIEELTRSVLESGLLREETDRYVLDGALPPFAIPTTLQDCHRRIAEDRAHCRSRFRTVEEDLLRPVISVEADCRRKGNIADRKIDHRHSGRLWRGGHARPAARAGARLARLHTVSRRGLRRVRVPFDNRLTYTYGSAAAHVAVDPGTGDRERAMSNCSTVSSSRMLAASSTR
jgi:hypothetical protein